MTALHGNPYVVGQWVRGERFYGRRGLIAEILHGNRNSMWVLGTRRIGKTSLLKQLEHLTAAAEAEQLPIFWDFQGAADPAELKLSFTDALLDAEERLVTVGIHPGDVADDDLFQLMGKLRRLLQSRQRTLLLLCDEVEELLNLHREDPALLRKLRRAMQSHDGVRTVITSSVRLCALAEQRDDTSPFLHGFSPPLYIGRLSDDEAVSLARQDQVPHDAFHRIEIADAAEICRRSDNHPYLIQLVCKRFVELGDLDEACRQVGADRMINYFFAVDFEMLSTTEQSILRTLAQRGQIAEASAHTMIEADTADLADALQRLDNLGFIARNEYREYLLPSHFLRRWLEDRTASQKRPAAGESPVNESDTTVSLQTIDRRYTLVQEIGAGATGSVFKARDTLLDTWVAIKLLKPEYTANREALDRSRLEIILSRDLAHPNILRVYHMATYEGGTYLTMQWIDGGTLADVIAREAPLPASRVVTTATKLASALAAAHSHNILHRDIKPGNILVDRTGEPYLADFGLARLIGETGVTRHGVFVGTPHYASPEQIALEDLDERSDLYGLGLVIFEMMTGRRPFEADSLPEVLAMHRTAPPPDPREFVPGLSGELAVLLLRCLAKKPANRLESAAELEGALRRIADAL